MSHRRAITAPSLALLVLSTLCLAVPHARAQTPTGSMQLVSFSTAVEPGGDVVARVRVPAAPIDAQLRLTVYGRTRTRSAFQATLPGAALGRPIAPAIAVPIVVDADGAVTIAVHTTGTDAPVIPITDEGIFPVTIELVATGGAVLDHLLTYVVRLSAATDTVPLGVATIVPLRADPLVQPDGSVRADRDTHDRIVARASAIAASSVPITINPSPETLTSAATLGSDVGDVLARAAASNEVVDAPFVDVDAAAWISAGLDRELTSELDVGRDAMTALGTSPTSTTYVSDRSLTPDALRWLTGRGYRNVVVPDRDLSPLDGRRFPTALTQPFTVATATGVTVAIDDAALAAHVHDSPDPEVAANHLLADLAILFFDQPKVSRFAVVALPDDVSSATVAALLDGLRTTRVLRPMTISTAFQTVPVVGARGETDGRSNPLVRTVSAAPASLGSTPSRLRSAQADLDSYAGSLEPNDAHATALRQRLLTAGAIALSEQQRLTYIDGVERTVRDELHKVAMPSRQSITFTARDGVVSFIVHNAAGYPIRAVAQLQGAKLEFRQHPDGTIPLTLANGATRLEIDVRTLTSGDSPLDVTLTTPDGRIELGRTRVTIRSTAFSGVGLFLSVGAGLFLIVWWARHTAETRRASQQRLRHAVRAGRHPSQRPDAE